MLAFLLFLSFLNAQQFPEQPYEFFYLPETVTETLKNNRYNLVFLYTQSLEHMDYTMISLITLLNTTSLFQRVPIFSLIIDQIKTPYCSTLFSQDTNFKLFF